MKSAGSPRRRQRPAQAWRVVAAFLVAALLSVSPAGEQTAEAQTTTCTAATLNDLATCLQLYDNASFGVITIELQADIQIPVSMTIYNTSSARLVFNGNGHALTRSGSGDIIKHNRGTADYNDLTISGASGDGIEVAFGPVLIQRSTITGNGRGVFVDGPDVQIVDSTIHNNTGEGIKLGSDQQVVVFRSTIADNSEAITGGSATALLLVGSLLARNDGANCSDIAVVNETGGNIVDDGSCAPIAATANVGSSFAAALAANGCSMPCTQTLALFPGSAAIDAYSCSAGFTDQRGEPRPASACDAGAFEGVAPAPALCDGRLVTIDMNDPQVNITGTNQDDVILGTPGPDVINSLAGADTICAGAGDDEVRSGSDVDRVFGENGDDTIFGGGGGDVIFGGAGADVIDGQGGADTIYGGDDQDAIDGRGAADVIHGGDGDDTISGQNGLDIIRGGHGADLIRGQTGPDVLLGEVGDDDVFGGEGADTLYGGPGFDKCAGNAGPDQAQAATCNQTPGVETLF